MNQNAVENKGNLSRKLFVIPLIFLFLTFFSCTMGCSSTPEINYYSFPIEPVIQKKVDSSVVLAIEPLQGDAAYDDARMVYRTSPYNFNYYYYHRWANSPASLLSSKIREDFLRSEKFKDVILGYTPAATLLLTGRLVSLDQIEYDGVWKARVGIDFSLYNGSSRELLWNSLVVKDVAMQSHQPEDFAVAAMKGISEIVKEILPRIVISADVVESGNR